MLLIADIEKAVTDPLISCIQVLPLVNIITEYAIASLYNVPYLLLASGTVSECYRHMMFERLEKHPQAFPVPFLAITRIYRMTALQELIERGADVLKTLQTLVGNRDYFGYVQCPKYVSLDWFPVVYIDIEY